MPPNHALCVASACCELHAYSMFALYRVCFARMNLAPVLAACLLAALAVAAHTGEEQRPAKELERLPATTPVTIVLTDGRALEGDYDPQRGVISVPVGRGKADIPVDLARVAHWSLRRPATNKTANDLLLETPAPEEAHSLGLLDDGSWEAEAMCAYILEVTDIVGTVEQPGGMLGVVVAHWPPPHARPENIFIGPVQEAMAGLYGSRLLLPVERLPHATLEKLRQEQRRLRVPRWVFAKELPLCDPSIREPLAAWHREFRQIVGAWDKAVLQFRRLRRDAEQQRQTYRANAQRLQQLYREREKTPPQLRAQSGQYVQYHPNPAYERIEASIKQLEERQCTIRQQIDAYRREWNSVVGQLRTAASDAAFKLQQLHRLFVEHPKALPEAWRTGCFPTQSGSTPQHQQQSTSNSAAASEASTTSSERR